MARKQRVSNPIIDPVDGYTPPPLSKELPPPLAHMDATQLDGYVNELSGIGDWNSDKRFGGNESGLSFLTRFVTGTEIEERWRGSDLGGRIVESKPGEMTRAGWEISIQPASEDDEKSDAAQPLSPFGETAVSTEIGPEFPRSGALPGVNDKAIAQSTALEAKLRALGAEDAILDALCYEVAYGGGAILLGVDDGPNRKTFDGYGGYEGKEHIRLDARDPTNLTDPLDETKIKSINHLTAFRGGWDGEIIAWRYYNDPRKPRYGEPEIYQLRNLGVPISTPNAPGETTTPQQVPVGPTGPTIFYVHESRLIVFPGTAVSHRTRVQMRGWGDSVFTRIDQVLADYDITWGAVGIIMQEFSVVTLSIPGLLQTLASKDPKTKGAIVARAKLLHMTQSIARCRLIDATENYTRTTASLTNVAEVLREFALRLAAAADMPLSLLMGQTQGGLGNAGNTDLRFFYDRIASLQKKKLLPPLRRLIRLLMLAKDSPTDGKEPARWAVTFNPLWQATEGEIIEQRHKQAEIDQMMIQNQVLTPAEVTASRYGGPKYSHETVIDFEGRKAMAALDLEHAKAAQERSRRRAAELKGQGTSEKPPALLGRPQGAKTTTTNTIPGPREPGEPTPTPGGGGVVSGR